VSRRYSAAAGPATGGDSVEATMPAFSVDVEGGVSMWMASKVRATEGTFVSRVSVLCMSVRELNATSVVAHN
jgi:hypothetical protein